MGVSNPSSLDIKEMQEFSQKFVKERDWEQYQTPKNVAMGVSIEASELMEIFQWLTDQQSYDIKDDPKKKGEIADEIGDILHYLIIRWIYEYTEDGKNCIKT